MSSSDVGLAPYPDEASLRQQRVAGSVWQRRSSAQIVSTLARIGDALALLAAGLFAFHGFPQATSNLAPGHVTLLTLLGTSAAAYSWSTGGLYALPVLQSLRTQIRIIAAGLAAALLCSAACLFLFDSWNKDNWAFALTWLLAGSALIGVIHVVITGLITGWAREGRLSQRIAIIGSGERSRRAVERVRQAYSSDAVIVGVYDAQAAEGLPDVLARRSLETLVRDNTADPVDAVVIAVPNSDVGCVKAICEALQPCAAAILLSTDVPDEALPTGKPAATGELIVQLRPSALTDQQIVRKAMFDFILAFLLVLVTSPLLLLIAVAIKLDSPGPMLFRQPRVGFSNRMFFCLKFRTMFQNMEDRLADQQTTRNDPRITRVGRVVRKLSLDELPQLFNVLRGDMSLVGPRPHAPNTKAADRLFREVVANYDVRHRVRPGITGWAQVNGWRGETRTLDQIRNRVAFDLFYIENWSLALDLKILALTAMREIFSRRAF